MITDETGREYHRNRRHIHCTQEPAVTINDDLSDELEPLTMQSSVNFPSVTRESDAEPGNQSHPILMFPQVCVALLGLDLFQFGIRIMLCSKNCIIDLSVIS